MSKSVLIVAAHPDDELLGVGATARRHVVEGDQVHILIVCEGESLRYTGREAGLAVHARRAADALGFSSLTLTGLPDQRLDALSLVEIIAPIEKHVRDLRPCIVYTHYFGDLNRDHRLVSEATMVACRPVETYVEAIYSFETPSATEWNTPLTFSPNYFVDVADTLEDKLKAFACYETEVRDYPHPRSIESLRHRACYWGSLMNVRAAEAFVTLRAMWR